MTTAPTLEQVNQSITEHEGKYLTFTLADQEYGLEILKVREIIGFMEITMVPQAPPHVKGVMNLRGRVIPVIDLRTIFSMPVAEITDESCIIVVETSQDDRSFSVGIAVDRVVEVLDIEQKNIEPTPHFGQGVNTDFILGIAKVGESVKILLNIDVVLQGDNIPSIANSDLTQLTDTAAQSEVA